MPVRILSSRSARSSRPDATPPRAGDVSLRGKRVVVMGLGRFGGGVGVSRWLAHQGARVLVTDLADHAALDGSLAQLAELPIEYRLGSHDDRDLQGADLLVVNPAVHKERSEFFQEAVARGIPWTTEINLFLDRCPGRVIGVTGTVGKSTTAAMIHRILTGRGGQPMHPVGRAGFRVYLGGNIGGSLMEDLATMSPQPRRAIARRRFNQLSYSISGSSQSVWSCNRSPSSTQAIRAFSNAAVEMTPLASA